MKNNLKIFFSTVTFLMLLISCEGNSIKDVQKINLSEFHPTGEADDFNLKYTDSGRIKSILISPKMLDYGNVEFPFIEFPKGIDVTMYDEKGKKTFVKAKYEVSLKGT